MSFAPRAGARSRSRREPSGPCDARSTGLRGHCRDTSSNAKGDSMHRFLALDRRHRRLLELVGAAVVIAAIVVVGLAATSGGSSAAPAFSPKQLASTPGDDWITNGGSISNDRYSALDQINPSNVAQLKGIWARPPEVGRRRQVFGRGATPRVQGRHLH